MQQFSAVLTSIAKGLGKRPEALLPFGLLFLAALVFWSTEVKPWWPFGSALAIYFLYCIRGTFERWYRLKQAEVSLRKAEASGRRQIIDKMGYEEEKRVRNESQDAVNETKRMKR